MMTPDQVPANSLAVSAGGPTAVAAVSAAGSSFFAQAKRNAARRIAFFMSTSW
jgi:hypothetical protein